VIYEPSSGPNGEPSIVNDETISSRAIWHMELEEGTWKLANSDQTAEWRGELECRT
jgi:hypothetical protein